MTAEARIQQVSDHLIRAITEDPTADYKMLEEVTCGLVTKEAKEGNGLDVAKKYYRSLRNLMGETTPTAIAAPKKRGRKPGTKNKTQTKVPTKVVAKPKVKVAKKKSVKAAKASGPAKKRGRPKGSKNKPKTEPTKTATE